MSIGKRCLSAKKRQEKLFLFITVINLTIMYCEDDSETATTKKKNEDDPENTFKIMIATDSHLGYAEKDAIRGDDSFNSFEEMLQLAVENEVDFILLAGDLFHDGKPTTNTVNRCMALLRHYCMGERPIQVEFLSDPAENFQHLSNPNVNYMDPNVNIAYPVFSIHGNHDDPLGSNGKCSLDMLSNAGLVNYFGRQVDMNNVVLSPLLMKKGTSQLAVYGLGALKEKMVHRLLRNNKVSLLCPPRETGYWFKILLLHQNRTKHKNDEYVPEGFLPKVIDLVIWGHEHECRLKLETSEERGFFISQPGSSVATSLSEGEAKQKQVGILSIKGESVKMKRIALRSVRPFVFRHVSLRDAPDDLTTASANIEKKVQCYLENIVEEMLEEAEQLKTGHLKQPELPLIRLSVEFTRTEQLFNLVKFGLQYQGKVANPGDMILKKNKIGKLATGLRREDVIDEDAFENVQATVNLHTVEEFVEKYFDEAEHSKQMKILTVRGLNDAMQVYIKKADTQAIEDLIEYQSRKTEKYLMDKDVDETELDQELDALKELRVQAGDQETQEIRNMLQNGEARAQVRANMETLGENLDDEDANTSTSSRGRATGKAAKPARSRASRGRGRGVAVAEEGEDEDIFSPSSRPSRGPGSRGGRAKATRATAKGARGANTSTQGQLDITTFTQPSRPQRPQAKTKMQFVELDSDSD